MLSWKHFGKLHGFLYRVTGGRFGASMGSIDVVLVETIGRKSGLPRTVPIACYPYRDSVAVSASNSGKDTHPAWYLNMQANPGVRVLLGKEHYAAIAEDVPDEEREALWASIIQINQHQAGYIEKTGRKIPLVWFRRSDL